MTKPRTPHYLLSLPFDEPRPRDARGDRGVEPTMDARFNPKEEEGWDPVCTHEFAHHSRRLDRMVRTLRS